jgi:hypothetical protein
LISIGGGKGGELMALAVDCTFGTFKLLGAKAAFEDARIERNDKAKRSMGC